jgi:hypothetical protein
MTHRPAKVAKFSGNLERNRNFLEGAASYNIEANGLRRRIVCPAQELDDLLYGKKGLYAKGV